MTETSLEYIEVARSYLIERENRLINTRKHAIEAKNVSTRTPAQSMQTTTYDPFHRIDQKRKSFSFTNMFRRPGSGEFFFNSFFNAS